MNVVSYKRGLFLLQSTIMKFYTHHYSSSSCKSQSLSPRLYVIVEVYCYVEAKLTF